MKGSQQYREQNSQFFIKLSNGKYGGFKPGVVNGPNGPVKVKDKSETDAKAS